MNPHTSKDAPGQPAGDATPGRPKESGSRQQTHPGQSSQSGAPDLDEELTRKRDATPVPAKPPGAK